MFTQQAIQMILRIFLKAKIS